MLQHGKFKVNKTQWDQLFINLHFYLHILYFHYFNQPYIRLQQKKNHKNVLSHEKL